jgi:hypothetical protein
MEIPRCWTIRFPWVELVLDEKGQVNHVCCMVCTFVEGKEKLLAPKLDSFLKHQGHHKVKKSMPRVDVG